MKKRKADGTVKLDPRRVDRLGGLPDDVLGRILGFLPTPLAVRASQLSRRWRRLWPAHVLALNLSVRTRRGVGVTFRDLCTEALSRFPTLAIPSVSLEFDRHVYTGEANPWYREAMERAAGSVRVTVPCGVVRMELPRCTRAEALNLTLTHRVSLELPAAGDDPVCFDRLTELVLATVRLPAGTPPLHEFLSSSCPRLRRLRLCRVRGGEAVRGLVLRSDALEALDVDNVDGLDRLDVVAPNLRSLSVRSCFRFPITSGDEDTEVVVSAPRVESICWYRSYPKRLTFPDGSLTHVRRLSGLKLATRGRSDQFDYPYTVRLLRACSHTTEYLELDLVLPDEATLLNWLGPAGQSSCEDLMSYVPPLPRVTVLWLTVRWGMIGANVLQPCLASLLSRAPKVTALHVDSAPYCLTVVQQSAVPPRGEYRWGYADQQKMSLDSLREVSVHGLRGTDGEECRLVKVLLSAVPPTIERISLAFRDGTPASTVEEIAAELRANFPMEAGRWTKTACSTRLDWTQRGPTPRDYEKRG